MPSNKKRRRDDDWEEDAYFDGFLKAEEEEFEEPIYCTCQRVSFGEMVGCDNPAVSVRRNGYEPSHLLTCRRGF